MRKLIRATTAGVMLAGFGIGLVGCADETGTKTETVVKGSGGTTTRTDETKIKTTGENPPIPSGPAKTP